VWDSDINLYLTNPNAGTPIYPGISIGVEGNYANNNTATNARLYIYDNVHSTTPFTYSLNTQIATFFVQTSVDAELDVTGVAQVGHLNSAANCSDSAGAAACGAAPAGAVVIDAGATTVVVSTTAVAANSQIFVTFDSSLSTRLGITCNATVALPVVSARTTSTSFTISVPAAPAVNPACFDYFIIN